MPINHDPPLLISRKASGSRVTVSEDMGLEDSGDVET